MKNSYKQGLYTLICLGIVIAFFYYLGAHHYISLASLQAKSTELKSMVSQEYFKMVLIYNLAFIGIMTIGIPISNVLTIIGGYLFGFEMGSLYAMVSSSTGVILSFFIIRYALGSLLQARYKERLDQFRLKFQTHGSSYLLTLYLLMVVPYVVIVILAALAEVPIITFVWTTIVGSLPLVLIYAYAGKELGSLSSAQEILSPHIIVLLALLIVVALTPIIVQRLKKGN